MQCFFSWLALRQLHISTPMPAASLWHPLEGSHSHAQLSSWSTPAQLSSVGAGSPLWGQGLALAAGSCPSRKIKGCGCTSAGQLGRTEEGQAAKNCRGGKSNYQWGGGRVGQFQVQHNPDFASKCYGNKLFSPLLAIFSPMINGMTNLC